MTRVALKVALLFIATPYRHSSMAARSNSILGTHLPTAAFPFGRLVGHVAVRVPDGKGQHPLHQLVETLSFALLFLLGKANRCFDVYQGFQNDRPMSGKFRLLLIHFAHNMLESSPSNITFAMFSIVSLPKKLSL